MNLLKTDVTNLSGGNDAITATVKNIKTPDKTKIFFDPVPNTMIY